MHKSVKFLYWVGVKVHVILILGRSINSCHSYIGSMNEFVWLLYLVDLLPRVVLTMNRCICSCGSYVP